jgi:large subunit ribosomal protein L29
MTKATELQGLADEELIAKIDEGRRELFNLRFQLATGQLDNSARMGQIRREVARLLTIQRQREIAAYEAEVENA